MGCRNRWIITCPIPRVGKSGVDRWGPVATALLWSLDCVVFEQCKGRGRAGPAPEPELYLRAATPSAFMPVMQYHSEFNHHRLPLRDRTPWHVGATHDDERVVPLFRDLARLRERLVPYLSDQARVAVATDRPLMRPLFVDDPGDPAGWAWPRQ